MKIDATPNVLMGAEWEAWQATNRALRDIGKSWDDADLALLHRAVVRWGECLAALRLTQSPDIRASAAEEADLLYVQELNKV